MLLNNYKESNLFTNSNFLTETSNTGVFSYRGELVLIEGGVGDDKGHAKPPLEVMRGAALLADAKLKMVIGGIDQLSSLSVFVEKYKADFAPDMKVVLYVVNIKEPLQVEIEGITFVLIPLVQGLPWNEIIEELYLEKSDFKGQSSADKVFTIYDKLQSYNPKYPLVSLDDALAATTGAVREALGAV